MVFNATFSNMSVISWWWRYVFGWNKICLFYVKSMFTDVLTTRTCSYNYLCEKQCKSNCHAIIYHIAEILPTGRSTTIIQYFIIYCRAVVIVIVWLLDLHPSCCEFESRSWRGVLDTTLCDKFCLWLAIGRWFFRCPPPIKLTTANISEILLKVALNIITLTRYHNYIVRYDHSSTCKNLRRSYFFLYAKGSSFYVLGTTPLA